jgi:hypothetical protein
LFTGLTARSNLKITPDRHNGGQKLNYCVHLDPLIFRYHLPLRWLANLLRAWRNLEKNALSSLHLLLLNRPENVCVCVCVLGGGVGGGIALHSTPLAGSVTFYAKTTVHCSPESSMVEGKQGHSVNPQSNKFCS